MNYKELKEIVFKKNLTKKRMAIKKELLLIETQHGDPNI